MQNEKLPYEILHRIFHQLDAVSLGRVSQVCKSWSLVRWVEADFGTFFFLLSSVFFLRSSFFCLPHAKDLFVAHCTM